MPVDEKNELAVHLQRIKTLTEELERVQDACAEGKRIAEHTEREADSAREALKSTPQQDEDHQRDVTCTVCGSRLVPPHMASGFTLPPRTDYVCIKCGRAYLVAGDPPRLVSMFVKDARPIFET
jgi:DNA-directed RNA polymerase subunit RPC12/RpoP